MTHNCNCCRLYNRIIRRRHDRGFQHGMGPRKEVPTSVGDANHAVPGVATSPHNCHQCRLFSLLHPPQPLLDLPCCGTCLFSTFLFSCFSSIIPPLFVGLIASCLTINVLYSLSEREFKIQPLCFFFHFSFIALVVNI